MRETSKHKLVKVERKLNNMDQVMDITKLNKFNSLKSKVDKFG